MSTQLAHTFLEKGKFVMAYKFSSLPNDIESLKNV